VELVFRTESVIYIFSPGPAEYTTDPQIAHDVVCGASGGWASNNTNQGDPITISAAKKFNFYIFNAR
jgi:hypothetical protein